MDNYGFQDSPLSSVVDRLQSCQHMDDLVPQVNNMSLEKEAEKTTIKQLEENILCSSPLSSNANDTSPLIKENTKERIYRRQNSNKNKNALLKQALFKPYVDEIDDVKPVNNESKKSNQINHQERRKPLSCKRNLIISNQNITAIKKDDGKMDTDKKNVLGYRHELIEDKENLSVH